MKGEKALLMFHNIIETEYQLESGVYLLNSCIHGAGFGGAFVEDDDAIFLLTSDRLKWIANMCC